MVVLGTSRSIRNFYLYRYAICVLLCLKLQIHLSSPFTIPPQITTTTSIGAEKEGLGSVNDIKSLFPYQKEGVDRLLQSKRLLLADEMGLGKTIQCIAAINKIGNDHRLTDPKSSPPCTILIICPKSLLGVWQTELETWLTVAFDIYAIATAKDFPPSPPPRRSITLINYDICHKFHERLHATSYDVLICDEAHYLKSPSAKRTLAVIGDCTKLPTTTPGSEGTSVRSEYLWMLTGTPVLNRPVELFPLLYAVCPTEFPSFDDYADRYCAPKAGYTNGRYIAKMDYSGASNLLELSTRLKPFMLRRYKSDILTQLPPKIRSCVCLVGSDDAAESERERIRDVLLSRQEGGGNGEGDGPGLEDFGSEASSLESYLENSKSTYGNWAGSDFSNKLMGTLTTVRKETAMTKLKPSIDLLEDIIIREKVVVFAHHRDLVLRLTEHFADRAVCVMGGTDTDARSDAVRRFQKDEDIRVFVGSVRTAGLGLTLTAASRVVFLELDWSPGVMVQAEDRCHRVGQRDSVRVQYYVFKNTIDEWIAKSLLNKQSNIEQIMPEAVGGVDTAYVFDFGKHVGVRLEDVPRDYLSYLLKKEVWRNRPKLWQALFRTGMVFENPPLSSDVNQKIKVKQEKGLTKFERKDKNSPPTSKKDDSQDVITGSKSNAVLPSSLTANTNYVFDFGKYNGKKYNDVPNDYIKWIIREGVWKNRPNLKTALIEGGFQL